MEKDEDFLSAFSYNDLRVNTRGRVAFDLSPTEFRALFDAAKLAGIPVNTLARSLFRWALPLFEAEGFSVAELKRRLGDGAEVANHLDPNAQRKLRPKSSAG